ncbi:TetR/AcrR family transcriptional regulator [Luteolibacter arcticus]|uniref:TetR/AcrR family transcriptional regulator n=1 Tax=Luteolibacter arcticus TaxID=1581411 RepID=A0ABT3GKB9_9BACT|nr:TetR/AcrR family transcriptional regulator [Luteolibacter arcticus]MCW1923930.1 TetR/AcrR family transcriptional regulator [Luteolibacter arcticus]
MPARKQTSPGAHVCKGRPRTFDRQAALEKALAVFWLRGYEPATMAELCGAMEINPPSLYAAFGNKAQLFLEAVKHYENVYWDSTWTEMGESLDIREGLLDFFKNAARILTSLDVPCGCMVILGATNVSPEAQEVNDALRELRKEGKDFILARLERAVEDGQLVPSTDVEGLAFTLNTLLEGMSLQARDGMTRSDMERIAETLMALLPVAR